MCPRSCVCSFETLRLSPHHRELTFFGEHVCRVKYKYTPQPLRSHIKSFGTLKQLLKYPLCTLSWHLYWLYWQFSWLPGTWAVFVTKIINDQICLVPTCLLYHASNEGTFTAECHHWEFPLALMGVLAPRSAHARPSAPHWNNKVIKWYKAIKHI